MRYYPDMRRVGWILGATTFVGWMVACVGSDPAPSGPQADPNVPVGQWKGACTADGRCIEGLVCTQGVCLYPGDGAPPPADASSGGNDGSSSSSSGGTGPSPECSQKVTVGDASKVECGSAGTCNRECCIQPSGPVACDSACTPPGNTHLACDSRDECGTGPCCIKIMDGKVLDTMTCPYPIAAADVVATACISTGCDYNSNQFEMCRSDEDCSVPTHKCRQIEIKTATTKLVYGICL